MTAAVRTSLATAARTVDLVKVYGSRRHRGAALDEVSVVVPAAADDRDHGAFGFGQVDAAALPRRARLR